MLLLLRPDASGLLLVLLPTVRRVETLRIDATSSATGEPRTLALHKLSVRPRSVDRESVEGAGLLISDLATEWLQDECARGTTGIRWLFHTGYTCAQ